MNACKAVQQYLEIFALEEKACTEAERVQEHLASCSACRSQVRELREAWSILPSSLSPVTPGPSMEADLMARIQAHQPQPRGQQWEPQQEHLLVRYHWLRFPVAAAAMIGLFSLLSMQGFWPVGVPGADETPMAAELESLAEALEKIDLIKRDFGAPQLQYVSLQEVRPAAQSLAFLVYDWASREGHFLARGLTPLPGDSVYKLWLLGSQGEVLASSAFLPNAMHLGTTLIALPDSVHAIRQVLLTRERSRDSKRPSDALELQSGPRL